MNSFKNWFNQQDTNRSFFENTGSQPFSNLVNDIYLNIIQQKKWDHKTLEDHFYHYLTGGVQGLGYSQYNYSKVDKNKLKDYQQKYQQIKGAWNYDEGMWEYEEGGSYEYFNKKNYRRQSRNHNRKRYITLRQPKNVEMTKLGILLNNLFSIPSVFSLKVPVFVNQLIDGIDNIVIYYEDQNDESSIEQAIKSSGIQEEDRSQYHRGNYGKDVMNSNTGKNESDTEVASKFFVQKFREWINQQVPQTGSSVLRQLSVADADSAKKAISDALLTIFRYTVPHRN
jgi:hypothetical protein